MERFRQRLARSLKTARAAELPADASAAISTLFPLVMRNEAKAVSELLTNSDFNVNHPAGSKRTLLHIAANVGASDCLAILIKKGADVNAQDRSGVTPLQLAARNGHTKCIHKLLENRADIEKSNSDGMTPYILYLHRKYDQLHWIASNGRTELLNDFLPFIRNIDIEDSNKQTPLHLACLTGHKITVGKLIDSGADFERLDARGYTPLLYACSHGHADLVSDLLRRRAKLSHSYGNVSPLQIALENGHKEVCYVLVQAESRLLDELLTLSQDDSVAENKALDTLKFICGMNEEFHRTILIRLAEKIRIIGLELLCSSSDYSRTQQIFFRNVALLCSLYSLAAEDMVKKSRTESFPSSMRSRIDSTSTRVLRTLTNTAVPRAPPFEPPIEQIDDSLSALWSSLEHWFTVIKDEINKMPESEAVDPNPDSESAIPKSESTFSNFEDQCVDSKLIASELMRSKPKDMSMKRRSTASIDSLRLSQPAMEFNMARHGGDLASSGGLSRDLGRMIFQRSLSSGNREPSLNYQISGSPGDSPEDEFLQGQQENADGNKPILNSVYENALLSGDTETLRGTSVTPVSGAEETSQNGNAARSDDELQGAAADGLSNGVMHEIINTSSTESSITSRADSASLDANYRQSRDQGDAAVQPVMSRAISYTHAIGRSPFMEGNERYPVRGGPLHRLTSFGAYSANSDEYSEGFNSNASSLERSTQGSDVVDNKSPRSPGGNGEVSMVEKFADRLCAIVHGFHLTSYKGPYWESARKFRIRASKFDQFIERNEEVLQLFVARKPKLIFDHFQFLLDSPLLLQRYLPVIHQQPFKERQEWFYENLHKGKDLNNPTFDEKSLITVARESLLLSSCGKILNQDSVALKRNLAVQFEGEAGMGDGVVREWLDLLFKEVLNPDYALFTLSADGSTFQPNSNSAVNPDHLNYFQFAGRMMGLAMYHKRLISASFTRSFYKHILGIPVNYQDVASMDPEYAKSLQWILDNDISDLGLDLTFAVESKEFGQVQAVALKAGGHDILVTEKNKDEYVQLAADMKMTKAIKPQIYSFLEGFHEFIPHSLVALFDEYELELVLSGVPEIDCKDWKENAIYQSGYDADSQPVKSIADHPRCCKTKIGDELQFNENKPEDHRWFWEVVEELEHEDRAILLQFVTGRIAKRSIGESLRATSSLSRVPWGGFAGLMGASGLQKFTISAMANNNKDMLPSASTCFNLLKLPEYASKGELHSKLMTALKHGAMGFEFA